MSKVVNNTNFSENEELVCKPLQSIEEIDVFLRNPPLWRSLTKSINIHSELAIKNISLMAEYQYSEDISPNKPVTFCHKTFVDIDDDVAESETSAKTEVKRPQRKTLPQTLICHDMANGYHDDSFIDGTSQFDAYTLYNWSAVDIFCYFSHHMITIPPLGWINVAHQHGTKVIGTVITEWKKGALVWKKLLNSPNEWHRFADGLTAIASTLNFDGWLLNIENHIEEPEELLKFVEYLHQRMHHELPNATLIWYDSVCIDGKLDWQNSLNDKNKAFFDASDGIFTNYSWSELDVESSATLAGDRITQLFIGIDVWGRNFYGGGKFNTQQAVQLAHKYGCSLAIFAPAWTHEAIEDPQHGVALDKFTHFMLRDHAFWTSLWPFLNTKLPNRLPFITSFCKGLGKKRWLYGEVISPSPWFNLRHMMYQLNSNHGPHGYTIEQIQNRPRVQAKTLPSADNDDNGEKKTNEDSKKKRVKSFKQLFRVKLRTKTKPKDVEYFTLKHDPSDTECQQAYYQDAFIGGCCIKINPKGGESTSLRTIRLLHCDFSIDQKMIVCVVTKKLAEGKDQYLDLLLNVANKDGGSRVMTLKGNNVVESIDSHIVHPVNDYELFKALQKYLLLHEPGFYVSPENAYGWIVRSLVIKIDLVHWFHHNTYKDSYLYYMT